MNNWNSYGHLPSMRRLPYHPYHMDYKTWWKSLKQILKSRGSDSKRISSAEKDDLCAAYLDHVIENKEVLVPLVKVIKTRSLYVKQVQNQPYPQYCCPEHLDRTPILSQEYYNSNLFKPINMTQKPKPTVTFQSDQSHRVTNPTSQAQQTRHQPRYLPTKGTSGQLPWENTPALNFSPVNTPIQHEHKPELMSLLNSAMTDWQNKAIKEKVNTKTDSMSLIDIRNSQPQNKRVEGYHPDFLPNTDQQESLSKYGKGIAVINEVILQKTTRKSPKYFHYHTDVEVQHLQEQTTTAQKVSRVEAIKKQQSETTSTYCAQQLQQLLRARLRKPFYQKLK